MKKFNVLDRSLNIHDHYLLEASAGTGKTFSIQNIVVRLLIEDQENEEPFILQKILVVTFTKAATRDLKIRIRSNIEQAINYLEYALNQNSLSEQAPDYLKKIIEHGEQAIHQARKRLQQALFIFEQAQIFTIHAFCARMLRQFALETDMGLHALVGEDSLSQSEMMNLIRDFFRTEVRIEQFSPAQLEILLKEDPNQRKLLKTIQRGYDFPIFPSFNEIYQQFVIQMTALKKSFSLTSEKMIEDFRLQIPFYRSYQTGETKAETIKKISRFAQLFDQTEWSIQQLDELIYDGLVWVKALDIDLLKNQLPPQNELYYPELTKSIKNLLFNLIEEASYFPILLARMARDCQQLLKRYQHEEEKLSPDDILRKMRTALNHPSFIAQVQPCYQAAIIDEFQDTDPLQWQIFRHLFLPESQNWQGYLYLVGDPKQSIYSFRQADIYTYLTAAQVLGEARCFSLDVNYRAQPQLVQALNALFDNHNLPHFITLPKKSTHLPYQPVHFSASNQDSAFKDEKGAIHFFIADGQAFKKPKITDLENHVFFPFIAQEIKRLKQQKNLIFKQFAVLVRDRHQALRLAEFLEQKGIPYLNQRGTSLAESEALQSLTDLIRAVLHPQDRGLIRTALGSALLGWTHEDFKNFESLESTLLLIQHLKISLFEKGFAAFFQELMQAQSKLKDLTIQQHLLMREGGLEFYRDLQQIADLIVHHRYKEWNSAEGIVPFLDAFQTWEENDDERVKRFQDPAADGVKILTLHFSKGLEFDIVFALGLVNRVGFKEDLIPIENDNQLLLSPLLNNQEDYHYYYEEYDAEKMRQLYVALTRAKAQLYIPIALHLSSDRLKFGEASPLDLFLARLNQPLAIYEKLYERIKNYAGKSLIDFLESIGHHHFMTYSIHQQIELNFAREKYIKNIENLKVPREVKVLHRSLWMTSFSALSQQIEKKVSERLNLQNAPHDYQSSIKDVHTLPANHETGLLMHHILEKLIFKNFRIVKNPEEIIPHLRPFIQQTAFKEWELSVANLVFNTLQSPLFESSSFCLADLDSNQLYREMPFIFPYKKDKKMEEINFEEGLIKGVIDLLFCHQGLYYLVDWKTNWLGPQITHYHSASLKIAMKENAYFLQANLYMEAIKRYLKIVDKRPFNECFGGVFYLFLRGMQARQQTGVFYFLDENI